VGGHVKSIRESGASGKRGDQANRFANQTNVIPCFRTRSQYINDLGAERLRIPISSSALSPRMTAIHKLPLPPDQRHRSEQALNSMFSRDCAMAVRYHFFQCADTCDRLIWINGPYFVRERGNESGRIVSRAPRIVMGHCKGACVAAGSKFGSDSAFRPMGFHVASDCDDLKS